jgi:hypothetical protein
MKKHMGISVIILICSLLSVNLSAQPDDIIDKLEPASASAGSNVTVTLTLKDLGTPPVPPSEVQPTKFMIGSVEGTNINRNELEIYAQFSFSSSETNGMKTVSFTFPGPNDQEITFNKSAAFEITGGTDDPGDKDPDYSGEVTLFAPMGNQNTYLIDSEGEIVHSWQSSKGPALAAYMLDDKSLLRCTSPSQQNQAFSGGGGGGKIERFDWDGNLIWEFEYSSDTYILHHDIEYLPNGNVLMIAWEKKSEAEAIAAGRDPSKLTDGEIWSEKIIEVQPDGSNGGTIVWEWHAWDHLVQDFDATKPNYGVVSEQPGKINLNFTNQQAKADWIHINSIDYNEELDQIILTPRNWSEIWIIDHNTTTQEAAGAMGDIIYRWGNPQAYDRGSSNDQILFGPHDGQWIESDCPGAGDIIIFNNGQGRSDGNYSSIEQFTPPVNGDGTYSISSGQAFGPSTTSWDYTSNPKSEFYADHISGCQRLKNGNTLICEGTEGRFFEVTSAGEVVWEYINPYYFGQGDNEKNEVFRCYRYDLSNKVIGPAPGDLTYPIVDSDQGKCFDLTKEISPPAEGSAYYGQDAQFVGYQPSYTKSEDGLTVYDNVTQLTWTQSSDHNRDGVINSEDVLTYDDAENFVNTLNSEKFGGYDDWRLPTMKELYSLMNFRGNDPTSDDVSNIQPFINTDYFDFAYGDLDAGARIIDAQYWSANVYADKVFGHQEAAFGLNLADGRIKGYPISGPVGIGKYVYYCRGNTDYGINDFKDNGDNTITDRATGLMWAKEDCGPQDGNGPRSGMKWEDALAWVQQMNKEKYLGYSDWRMPNAKEMQSILDYSRSPSTTNSAAMDPIFNATEIENELGESDYPWYWTSTTHKRGVSGGQAAVYICFGRAFGYMNGEWLDVHGAGCQRSDSKSGNFSNYTYVEDGYYFGNAPQGDASRMYNYVRLVRDAEEISTSVNEEVREYPESIELYQNSPNPFNNSTKISFNLSEFSWVTVKVYTEMGQEVATLAEGQMSGYQSYEWNAANMQSGVYFVVVKTSSESLSRMMILIK